MTCSGLHAGCDHPPVIVHHGALVVARAAAEPPRRTYGDPNALSGSRSFAPTAAQRRTRSGAPVGRPPPPHARRTWPRRGSGSTGPGTWPVAPAPRGRIVDSTEGEQGSCLLMLATPPVSPTPRPRGASDRPRPPSLGIVGAKRRDAGRLGTTRMSTRGLPLCVLPRALARDGPGGPGAQRLV